MSAKERNNSTNSICDEGPVPASRVKSVDFRRLTEIAVKVTRFAKPEATYLTKKAELSDNLHCNMSK